MASETASLIVPALLGEVPSIRSWLQGVLANWTVSAAVIADLALAVTELCMNIVVHGYGNTVMGEIEVRLTKYDHIIRITILDSAPVFIPPSQIVFPAPHMLAERGYGLALVCALVDEFVHQGLGTHGNCVTLVKKDLMDIQGTL
jgi:anti-sigma regulatory factor (Ser/Thr protein kinase)